MRIGVLLLHYFLSLGYFINIDFLITKTVFPKPKGSFKLAKDKLVFFFFFKFLQYRLYGEPVVKACIENGTSCIDISGEPQVWKMKKKKNPILLVFC